MTKNVRIENADISAHKVVVEVWDKGYPEGQPDTLSHTLDLDYPTAMVNPAIHSGRYLIVREKT